MDKKILASEYLLGLRFLFYGLCLWFGFMLIFSVWAGTMSLADFLMFTLLGPFSGGDITTGDLPFIWGIILLPYIIMSIARSIRWARSNQ